MRTGMHMVGLAFLALSCSVGVAAAQQQTSPATQGTPAQADSNVTREATPADILVDVPQLKLDSLHLLLDSLDAQVRVNARVAGLLQLEVQADVHVDSLVLDLAGLDAKARVEVRLDNLTRILVQLLTTLQENPALGETLLGAARSTLAPGSERASPGTSPQTGSLPAPISN